jgi:hypothetical protein
MTATYPAHFDAIQTLSRAQERTLLTALGLGLLVTVLALGWAAIASRVERAPEAVTHMGDSAALISVDRASAQWLAEDGPL